MEIRLATEKDLPNIKALFDAAIVNMYKNGIRIWSEVFPYCMIPEEVANKEIHVIAEGEELIAVFGLFKAFEGQECFTWQDAGAEARYLGRVNVNVKYLRQGFGKMILDNAVSIAREQGAKFLRLDVAKVNTPAENLYIRYGFKKVGGVCREYSPILKEEIALIGYELPI